MYDALAKRKQGSVKAVIAARFEDTMQSFDRLWFTYSPLAQHFPELKGQSGPLEESRARIAAWGHETGAKAQGLDYKLRKSKDLHDIVVQALQELQSSLDKGNDDS